jgi:hypothetical protein
MPPPATNPTSPSTPTTVPSPEETAALSADAEVQNDLESTAEVSTEESAEATLATEAGAAPAEEAAATEESDGSDGGIRPRVAVGAGYEAYDLSNHSGFDHSGPFVRLEGGIEVPFGDMFIAQANLMGELAWTDNDLGLGTVSKLQTQTIGANGRLGLTLFDDNFRPSLGLDLGAAHGGAGCQENEFGFCDGESGTLYNRNAILYDTDSWGLRAAVELSASFLQGSVNIFGRVGGIFGWNPVQETVTQPDTTAGVNITEIGVGASVEVFGLIRAIEGASSSSSQTEEAGAEAQPAEEAAAAPEAEAAVEGEGGPEEAGGPAGTVTVGEGGAVEAAQGLALIQQYAEQVRGENGLVAQIHSAEEASVDAYQRFRAAKRTQNPDATQLRVLALEVYQLAERALGHYAQIQTLIGQANEVRSSDAVSSEERRDAARLVHQMRRARNTSQGDVNRTFGRARSTVRQHNRISDEDIEFELRNPVRSRGGQASGNAGSAPTHHAAPVQAPGPQAPPAEDDL